MMSQLDLFGDMTFTQDTPFTDRVVCVLGSFTLSQKNLFQRLQELGADAKPSTKVSRNVHFVLVGRGAPQDQLDYLQTLSFHGYSPRVLYQHDLDQILQGHYSDYRVSKEISKSLHLTYQHYLRFRTNLDAKLNPMYMHEVFVASNTQTPSEELYQRLGNKGVYANPYIDDSTDVLLLADETIQKLKDGETDGVIANIENTYNASRSQNYSYVIVPESEVLSWLDRSSNP